MAIVGKFEGYRLRELEERDYEQLKVWIREDPAHAGILDPEFFMGQAIGPSGQLEPDERVSVFAVEDSKRTLFYVRLTRASRVQIQFPPDPPTDGGRDKFKALHRHRQQITNALVKGMAFLEVGLERAGAMEWIFDSESDRLRNMVQKRMGFHPSPNEMVRVIPRIDGQTKQEEP